MRRRVWCKVGWHDWWVLDDGAWVRFRRRDWERVALVCSNCGKTRTFRNHEAKRELKHRKAVARLQAFQRGDIGCLSVTRCHRLNRP